MKIAVACFPGLGGSGVIAAELAHGLVARGHQVWIVATALPQRLHANGVRYEQLEVPTSPALEHAPYGLALAGHLVELVRREAIDVVHLHYAVPHAASAMLAKQVLGAAAPAFVVTMHGTDVTRLGCHPTLGPVIAHALAASDGLTVPSRYLRDEAVRCFGLAPERIRVISNFVDVARFAPPPSRRTDGPTLIHVSNFRPVKRTGDLVDVLAGLRDLGVPASMILIGDGPERAQTEQRARGLPMRFLGKRDDFETLLGHADAFVLTSESESFGVAALEAMAAGVPVYGYHVGGLPEVVTPECGALVPLGDVRALALAIRDGFARREERGRAARARAESEFRAAGVIDAYEAYFEALR